MWIALALALAIVWRRPWLFVLIRLIQVPDQFVGWSGRGIGIFISLIASLLVIAAGLLRAGEEL